MHKTKRILSFAIMLIFILTALLVAPIDKTYASSWASGDIIALRANANGRYVCADNSGESPLIARSFSVGLWEKFVIEDAGNGQVALKAVVNNDYVCADNSGSSPLIANRSTAGDWEKFTIEAAAGGKIALKANANGKYVCAEDSGNGNLIARSDSIGAWEKFDLFVNPTNPTSPPGGGYLGVTFGFSAKTLNGGPYNDSTSTIYNYPLYTPDEDESKFWDNYVEELLSAGVDFVAPTIRGYLDDDFYDPQLGMMVNERGDPRKLADLVAAIQRRGAADKLKVSCFDDNPQSWTEKKNQYKYQTSSTTPLFDCADVNGTGEGGYTYIWEHNLRAYFQTVPDECRFKIDGRPVIYTWAVSPFCTNYSNGGLKNIINYIKSQCQSEFGVVPYIIVMKDWIDADPSCASVVDGVHNWYPINGCYTTYDFNGRRYGVCTPGIDKSSDNVYYDPNHGITLSDNLQNTVGNGSYVTLVEGFTDWEENTALWRAKNGMYSEREYDYPNQRINILRRYSRNPDLAGVRMEAEACDDYYDPTSGNSGEVYREGDLDIGEGTDAEWFVGWIDIGEWLEWKELSIQGSTDLSIRIATPYDGRRLKFVIDGVEQSWVSIPNTGGWQNWQIVDCGTYNFSSDLHTVRIYTDSNNFNIDYWLCN